MHKPILYFCLLLGGTGVFAQADHTFFLDAAPEITGHLIGYDPEIDGDVTVTYSVVVPAPEFQIEYQTQVSADGRFQLEVPRPLARQQVWLTLDGYYFGPIIMEKGLSMTFDLRALREEGDSFGSPHVQFSGPDGPLSTYLNKYISYEIPRREGNPVMEILMDRQASASDKWARVEQTFDRMARIEADFMAEHPSPLSSYLANERMSRYYGLALIIWRNEGLPDTLQQALMDHQPLLLSNDCTDYYRYLGMYWKYPRPEEQLKIFRQVLPLDTEQREERQRLNNFVQAWADDLAGKAVDQDQLRSERNYVNDQYREELFKARTDLFLRKIQQHPVSETRDLVRMYGGREDIWEQDIYLARVLPQMENDWLKAQMEERWAEIRNEMKAIAERLSDIRIPNVPTSVGKTTGTLPNGAELIEAAPMSIDSLLAGLRHDVDSKPLILDIWATWCGPCIYDMREATANLQKLKEKGIELVYLCVAEGSSPETWQKKVAEFDLPTRHVFLNKDQSRALMDYFNLRGYPSHVLLDAEGKFHKDVLNSISRLDWSALQPFISSR